MFIKALDIGWARAGTARMGNEKCNQGCTGMEATVIIFVDVVGGKALCTSG